MRAGIDAGSASHKGVAPFDPFESPRRYEVDIAAPPGERMDDEDDDEDGLDSDEEEEAVSEIKAFKGKTITESRISESSNRPIVPKKNQRR